MQVVIDAVKNGGPREDSCKVGSSGTVRRQAVVYISRDGLDEGSPRRLLDGVLLLRMFFALFCTIWGVRLK